jgi:drug/metabolite transporter (DMT)-like permease
MSAKNLPELSDLKLKKNAKPSNIMAYLSLTTASILYGGNIIAARVIANVLPPVTLSAMRGLLGLCILVPFSWQRLKEAGRPKRRDLWNFLLVGVLGVSLPYVSLVWGAKYTATTNVSIILAISPAVTITLLAVGWRVSPNLRQVLGIITSLAGLLLVFTKGSPQSLLSLNLNAGDLAIMINVISVALFSIVGQKVMKEHSPLVTAVYSLFFGTVILLPYACWEIRSVAWQLPWQSWLAVFYMGIMVTGFGFLFNLTGVHQVGPDKTAIIINLSPVVGIILGIILFKEVLYLYHWLGILMVLAGIFLSLLKRE